MDISLFATPCDGLVAGRRELRHGARLVPLCGITMYLVEQVSESKILHRCQAISISLSLSLSLSQVPPQVCHDTNRTAELNLRSGLEQFSLLGRVLCLAESPSRQEFLELVRNMAASDSESSMSCGCDYHGGASLSFQGHQGPSRRR